YGAGYREADAGGVAAAGRVHAHHPSVRVTQGPARVAWIDCRIGLEDVGQALRRSGRAAADVVQRAVQRRDHAGRDGAEALAAQRAADRDDRLADLQLGGVRELRHRQAVVHLQDRHVVDRVGTLHLGNEVTAVWHHDLHPTGPRDNVVVGQHVARAALRAEGAATALGIASTPAPAAGDDQADRRTENLPSVPTAEAAPPPRP